jgi:hypothetical protein
MSYGRWIKYSPYSGLPATHLILPFVGESERIVNHLR